MTPSSTHRLEGLEPDNLLAFLALLGLLRALEAAGWRPRVHWEGLPPRPVLSLPDARTQVEVAEKAAEGCTALALDYDFAGERDLAFDAARGHDLLKATATPETRGRAAVLGSLFSDGALREDGRIQPTPLCALFGQGHQHFLSRLADVPRGGRPKALAKRRPPPDLNAPNKLAAALFQAWERADETDSFRWDPAEDRRYALRFENPSTDAGRTVHGANRLAAIGLAALPGAAVVRRRGTRFLCLGAELDGAGGVTIMWPIWDCPASLAAIQALLAHPDLVAEGAADKLQRLGVVERRRARRIANGKFMHFTRAERV